MPFLMRDKNMNIQPLQKNTLCGRIYQVLKHECTTPALQKFDSLMEVQHGVEDGTLHEQPWTFLRMKFCQCCQVDPSILICVWSLRLWSGKRPDTIVRKEYGSGYFHEPKGGGSQILIWNKLPVFYVTRRINRWDALETICELDR